MRLVRLKDEFFRENGHLVEVLDKHNGVWAAGKTRRYGIVLVELSGSLTFGLPLRSRLRGKGYKTTGQKGLDYSKAVLISKPNYVGTPFKVPSDEYVKMKDRENHIKKQFGKYVARYIKLATAGDMRALETSYQFSTLQNYHAELGI